MRTLESERSYYHKWLRRDRATIRFARAKMVVFWLPARIGIPFAKEAMASQREIISHAKYAIEESEMNLSKLPWQYGLVPWPGDAVIDDFFDGTKETA